jgi:large conductance mechanosensitive channel
MLEEFKKFALRGSVVDLAVSVIISAAFGAIVSSMEGDIIIPIIGAITGGLECLASAGSDVSRVR